MTAADLWWLQSDENHMAHQIHRCDLQINVSESFYEDGERHSTEVVLPLLTQQPGFDSPLSWKFFKEKNFLVFSRGILSETINSMLQLFIDSPA